MAFAEIHPRIELVLGRPMPPAHVTGLDELPADIEADAATLYQRCGSLLAFAYLLHATNAGFADVKAYCAARGWSASVDE